MKLRSTDGGRKTAPGTRKGSQARTDQQDPPADPRPLMLGYVRVSTREQADEGYSLDAQVERLTEEAERRGYRLEIVADPGYSGRTDNRPGLQDALRRLKKRGPDAPVGLMVTKLDRLARSVQHFTGFIAASQKQGWAVVVLDFDLDTSTPNGRLVAHILSAVAQWESEMIGQRTRDGMAEAKAQGSRFGGIEQVAAETSARIVRERADGLTFREIAAGLDTDGVPTPAGGKRWYHSTVLRAWERAA